MTFAGTDLAYDRFMGRFSRPLAVLFADFADVDGELDVVDVGCGPGALTGELVRRVGAGRVSAADPTEQFVAATRAAFPDVALEQAPAEELPFADDRFDRALTQLVAPFMRDADAGIGELVRVTRPSGVVAACMWLDGADMELLQVVDAAARDVVPGHADPPWLHRYRTEAEGVELLRRAGLAEVSSTVLEVAHEYAGTDELWEAVAGGTGPLADLLAKLDEDGLARFRDALDARVGRPDGSFSLTGRAWAARGRVG